MGPIAGIVKADARVSDAGLKLRRVDIAERIDVVGRMRIGWPAVT